MNEKLAKQILEQVKSDYDAIASDFNKTRQNLWPGLSDFKNYVEPGDKVLDAGCGNGKLRLLFQDVKISYFGVDNSQKLLALARDNNKFTLPSQQFAAADVFELPFADNFFDVIFCLAVLHHLPGQDLRLKTLKEFQRVLKPGGTLVMTNWNRWQRPYLPIIIQYTFLKLLGKSQLDFKDIFLPWQNGPVKRYYHAFTLGEIKKLIELSGFQVVENYLSFWDSKEKANLWPLSYLKASNIVTLAKKC